jgi:hypothetical protein
MIDAAMSKMSDPTKIKTVAQMAKRSMAVTVELSHHAGKSLQLNPFAYANEYSVRALID